MIDPEILAKVVRMAWMEWARKQPNPKPSWLVPYEELSEADKDADRHIGLAIATYVLGENNFLDRYQQEVRRTTGTSQYLESLAMTAMGLAGETGEVCDILKKHIFHGHELDREKLIAEIGDVLWYLTALCNALAVPLTEIIDKNVEKLRRRYPDGFSAEKSKNREEEH